MNDFMNRRGVVLFLGAGFSKSISSNMPLGDELMKQIRGGLDDNVRKDINFLVPEHLSTSEGIQPFELLLAIVQRLRMQQMAGRPALTGIDAKLLWRILVTSVANATRFSHPGYYSYENQDENFSKYIKFLRELSRDTMVSIVTTNYDLISDKAAAYLGDEILEYGHGADPPKDLRRFQYGYPIRGVWTQSARGDSFFDREYKPWSLTEVIPVYKLHGSTNWVYCDFCKMLDLSGTRYDVRAIFRAESSAASCPYCRSPYEWLLVPPVPHKNVMDHVVLQNVWHAAEKALEMANLVIFIGYSFPLADPVVLEMVATARLRSRYAYGEPWTYWLFNREESVCQRYQSVFGKPDIKQMQDFSMEMLLDSWSNRH
jgi:NAD-dependent SIR2 family protein deacetylase